MPPGQSAPPNISNAYPVADKVNSSIFYIYNNGSGNLNRTLNGGATFAVTLNIGSGGNKFIRTIPGKEGHIWAALYNGGLKRSVDSGTTFTTIAGVTACSAVGYGKAAPEATYLTLYIWGTVGGVTGIFKSINEGASWTRVNDNAHQFGGPGNAQYVMGDMNTYDVVYMSTVGRGVVAGVGQGAILPVSLYSLSVQETNGPAKHLAQLNWKTATESNVSHFAVERSTDTRSWTLLGSLPTKATNGNSTALLNYNYPDDLTGLSGVVYYRLKMVDKNGSYVYSNTVSLTIGKPGKGLMVSVSPNPVEAATGAVVRFASEKNERVVLKVVDANGALLTSKTIELQAGNTSITLTDLINKASGIYLLNIISVETNKSIGTIRFVIPKN